MAKYIVQHRRATRDVLINKGDLVPLAGEFIVEFDEINSLHRLKIGDGIHTYSELAYLMAGDEILTQALPNIIEITLDKDSWIEDGSDPVCYCQEVVVEDASKNSRLDLQPDVDMLAEFQKLGLVFTTKNVGGVISVCSVGNKPASTYTMQATLIAADIISDCDKVLGIPIGSQASASASLEETNARVSDLESQMASISDMLYEPITIKTFSPSPSKAELGSTVNNPTLSWTTNKSPKALTLDGEKIGENETSMIVDGSFTSANPGNWKLVATDERGTEATESTSITFCNKVYWGAATKPDEYNRAFILSLSDNELRTSYKSSFTADAGATVDGKYIYYCQPVRLGVCFFKDGGFDFGNKLVATVLFKNNSGYEEQYYVYESDYPGLGKVTITVKDKDT